jgi:peptidoglycan hydrolase-like protein with peptidoglycan-binding domain
LPAHAKKILLITLACFFLLHPQPSSAQDAKEIICPINCDQSRELFLKNPPLSGEDVKSLQAELKELGFYSSSGSGVFDSETDQAVRRFQQKFGLAVNGRVGEKIWDLLAREVEKPGPVSTDTPPQGNKVILIDTHRCKLTLLVNGEPFRQFPVGLGKSETPTPIGSWKIVRKALHWGTGFGTRWMGLNVKWGSYGIHGTNKPYSIGGYHSHGCIRMHNRHVEQLYRWVEPGTTVLIVGNPFTYMDPTFKMMRRGDVGTTVMEVQAALKRLGYDVEVDGVWGGAMEKAIIKYRKDAGLPFDNAVDRAVYNSLGFKG